MDLLAAEDPGGDPEVFQLSVGARADEDLIQRRPGRLVHGDHVVGTERLGHLGAQPHHVEVVFRYVTRVRVGLIEGPRAPGPAGTLSQTSPRARTPARSVWPMPEEKAPRAP